MNAIVSSAVLVSLFCAMIVLSAKNIRNKGFADRKTKTVPVCLLTCVLLASTDLAAGGEVTVRLSWDLMLCLIPLMLLTSSLWEMDRMEVILRICTALSALTAVYYLCSAFSIVGMLPSAWFSAGAAVLASGMAGLYLYGIWMRIRDVKAVMKSGTVWAGVCLATDSIYVVSVLLYVLLYQSASSASASDSGVHAWVLPLLLAATACALTARVILDSAFVFLHTHERRIVESMKITQVEVMPGASRIDGQYRDIYERVVDYFEDEKPYLSGELTINDVVKVVYTNKLYISRAISQFTGRNFCQFVNYYRVMYSIELFRRSPELKIHELASLSGFNSMVSFNMAFRLFMGEIPSEWCRREKGKLPRRKK